MKKIKILWIEDDAKMIWGLVRPLTNEGFTVDVELDYARAVQRMETNTYDLIILDIIIPSGKELQSIEDTKNIEKYCGIRFLEHFSENTTPIIVLSVVNDPEILKNIQRFASVKEILLKGYILPSQLKEMVLQVLHKIKT